MQDIAQVNATNNQSTLTVTLKKMFIFDNRFEQGDYKNNTAGTVVLNPFTLVARDIGTFETATLVFNATKLAAGETMVIAGLTYTSTGDSLTAEVALAFANLKAGDISGQGTALGTYSGVFTGYNTGAVVTGTTVVFTSIVNGNVADLTAAGTGPQPAITVVNGSAAIADGLIPITADNLANVIGVSANVNDISQLTGAIDHINYGVKGTINEGLLVLPGGVTLDTLVGNKTLRDILEDIGFHLTKSTENTKLDNV